MPMLTIRPFTDADLRPVTALWAACNLIVPHNDPEADIAFCRSTPNAALFVGEADGAIVASIMTGHDGHRGWLYYLAVDPQYGGKGHGRRMVRHAEAWLKDHGVPKVNLMIRDTNEDVREFYQAIGYASEPRLVMARFLKDE
jgi:hypothetical protein